MKGWAMVNGQWPPRRATRARGVMRYCLRFKSAGSRNHTPTGGTKPPTAPCTQRLHTHR